MRQPARRTQATAVGPGAAVVLLPGASLGKGAGGAAVTTEQAATALLTPTAVPSSTGRCGVECRTFPRSADRSIAAPSSAALGGPARRAVSRRFSWEVERGRLIASRQREGLSNDRSAEADTPGGDSEAGLRAGEGRQI